MHRIAYSWLVAFCLASPHLFAQGDDDWDSRFNTLGITGTSILSLAGSGISVYAGGSFSAAGPTAASNIALFNGTSWSALGSGADGSVLAIAINGSNVYAGGSFSTAGGQSASNIAKWNGSSWSSLGSGINGDVRAIAIASNGDVYAGGLFTTAGGQLTNNIAKWDGSSWSALTGGVNSTVRALAIKNNLLYVGGSFTQANSKSANKITVWNMTNSTWDSLGTGMSNGDVNALACSGNNLIAGGIFTSAGGVSTKKIASWNGTVWSALGDGMTGGDIYALTVIGTDVYASGNFDTADSVSVSSIAKWDGSNWSALGSGITGGLVFASAPAAGNLYVGGSFSTAGGKTSTRIGLLNSGGGLGSLPVELVTFAGRPHGNRVVLEWNTATETRNYGFGVQRKTAGASWMEIGFVAGHGSTSEPQFYLFEDDVTGLAKHEGAIFYRLKQLDLDGSFQYHDAIEVPLTKTPVQFSLSQNYPNPFNPSTRIAYFLGDDAFVRLTVFSATGQKVAVLVKEHQPGGRSYEVSFNGESLASGVYYYQLQAGEKLLSRKMMLIK